MSTAERLLRQILEQYEKTDGYDVSNEMDAALRLAKEHMDHLDEPQDVYKPSPWYKAVDVKGDLWAESSNEIEVRARARGGDVILHLFSAIPKNEWRIAPDPTPVDLQQIKLFRAMLEEDE